MAESFLSRTNTPAWLHHLQRELLTFCEADHRTPHLDTLVHSLLVIPGSDVALITDKVEFGRHTTVVASASTPKEIPPGALLGLTAADSPVAPGGLHRRINLHSAIPDSELLARCRSMGMEIALELTPSGAPQSIGHLFLLSASEDAFTELSEDELSSISTLLALADMAASNIRSEQNLDSRRTSPPEESTLTRSADIELLPFPVFLLDSERTVIGVNAPLVELCGLSDQEMRGLPIAELISEDPGDRRSVPGDLSPLFETHGRRSRLLLRSDASQIHIYASALPGVTGSALEGTELVLVENVEPLFQELETLRSFTNKVEEALDGAPLGIFIADDSGRILYDWGTFLPTLFRRNALTYSKNARDNLTALGLTSEQVERAFSANSIPLSFVLGSVSGTVHLTKMHDGGTIEGTALTAGLVIDTTAHIQAEQALQTEVTRASMLTRLSRIAIEGSTETPWEALVVGSIGATIPGADATYLSHPSSEYDEKVGLGIETIRANLYRHSFPVAETASIVVGLERELTDEEQTFVEAVANISSMRLLTISYEERIKLLAYIDRDLELWNRQKFMDRLKERDNPETAALASFTLIRMVDAGELIKALGLRFTLDAARSWVQAHLTTVSTEDTLYALSSSELVIWREYRDPSSTMTSVRRRLEEMAIRPEIYLKLHDIDVHLRSVYAAVILDRSELTTYSDLYARLDHTSRKQGSEALGKLKVQTRALQAPSSMELLGRVDEYVRREESQLVFDPAVDLVGERTTIFEAKSTFRVLAESSSRASRREDAPVLASGLSEGVENLQLEGLITYALPYLRRNPFSPARFTLNVSPRSVMSGSLLRRLSSTCDRLGFPPGRLGLEISEKYLTGVNVLKLAEVVSEMAEIGVTVALDEVGRGYGSLELLRDVEFSYLKLSRSIYPEDPSWDRLNLTKIMINLADDLGVVAIATGVDTPELSSYLLEQGATVQQGSLFSGRRRYLDGEDL